jgi:hypothetical protein
MKLLSRSLSVLFILTAGVLLAACAPASTPTALPTPAPTALPTPKPGPDPFNATYIIEGQNVTLQNGQSTQTIPGSSAQIVTQNFSSTPTYGELTGDSQKDAAFVLTQTNGGSGQFFYVVASLKNPAGFIGTNGVLMGDRIAPQGPVLITNSVIEVSYADRADGEPMTTKPSVMKSLRLQVVNGVLQEVK